MQLLFAVNDSGDLIWGSWWSAHPDGHTLGKKGSFMTSKRLKCLNVQKNGLACSAFFRAAHSTLGSSSVSLYQKSGPTGTRALWASLMPSFCLSDRLQSIGASPPFSGFLDTARPERDSQYFPRGTHSALRPGGSQRGGTCRELPCPALQTQARYLQQGSRQQPRCGHDPMSF